MSGRFQHQVIGRNWLKVSEVRNMLASCSRLKAAGKMREEEQMKVVLGHCQPGQDSTLVVDSMTLEIVLTSG